MIIIKNVFVNAAPVYTKVVYGTGTGDGGGGGVWGTITGTLSNQSDLNTALNGKAASVHTHDDRYYTETETNSLLSAKANTSHTHAIADVTNLQTSLDGKAASSHTHTKSQITDFSHTHPISEVTNLQTTLDGKASSTHSHAISDVTGLQTALDGKAASSHSHAISDVTNLQTSLDGKQATLVSGTNIKTVNNTSLLGSGNITVSGSAAWGSITGTLSDQTDLQTALDGKQASLGFTAENSANKENTTIDTSTTKYPTVNLLKTGLDGKANSSHSHAISDVTGLQTALDGKAASSHSHAISDVTGLQTALDGKVDENSAITGATKTKITYDAKGLVTSGADATTADIADSTNKRYVTDAQSTVIGNTSGTNTGDETQSTIKTKLGAATTSVDGYLTSTDWNTFNGKQAALGFTAENSANKENSTIDTSTTKYPTVNLLKTGLDTKQATLVSGTNIKTINGDSILGSGDLPVSGGGGGSSASGNLFNYYNFI